MKAMGIIMVGAYLASNCGQCPRDEFVKAVTIACMGDAVLMGDFNARHRTLDRITNAQGKMPRDFVHRSGMCVGAPLQATNRVASGESVVDLLLTRNVMATRPGIVQVPPVSDHRPIIASMALSTSSNVDTIPLSLIKCERVTSNVLSEYERTLPSVLDRI